MGNDERVKLPVSEQVGIPVTIPPKTGLHSSLGWWKCACCVDATASEMAVIDDELSRVARLRARGEGWRRVRGYVASSSTKKSTAPEATTL